MRRLASALVLCATAACVVWPKGSGPDAGPMPVAEALAMRDRGEAVIIDVRTQDAYTAGHIPGALQIEASTIAERAAEIRRLRGLPILYCG
jgi:hydroxyacylglutathione hydrolase